MSSRRRDRKDEDSPPRPLDSAKLYVANLSERTRESALEDAFRKFGKVRDARIITDPVSGRSKGFAFVTMENAEDGRIAQQEAHEKLEVDGKRLIVEIARGEKNRRSEPYERRHSPPPSRRDESRERPNRDSSYPERSGFVDDPYRDRRGDRPPMRGYDFPPWPPRDYPWPYPDPYFHDRDFYRRPDERDLYRFPYPPPYPPPPPPPEEFYDRRAIIDRDRRPRDWERESRDSRDSQHDTRDAGRDRDWDRGGGRDRDRDRIRDRRDFPSDRPSTDDTRRDDYSHSTNSSSTSSRDRDDGRGSFETSARDTRDGDRTSQDRRRS